MLVREQFGDAGDSPTTITISSFGFARGTPPLADLVFDMRFLDNPHWVRDLRERTGLDSDVGAHIMADVAFAPAIGKIIDLLQLLLPRYAAAGKGVCQYRIWLHRRPASIGLQRGNGGTRLARRGIYSHNTASQSRLSRSGRAGKTMICCKALR